MLRMEKLISFANGKAHASHGDVVLMMLAVDLSICKLFFVYVKY